MPEQGIDAIAMAVECYNRLKAMVHEEAGELPYIWSVGTMCGGTAHNVIPDRCSFVIDIRPTEQYTNEEILEELKKVPVTAPFRRSSRQ